MHKVRSISELKKDGFALNEWSPLADLALLSLRIGLRSYFKTYASMRIFIHWAIEGTEPPEGTASHTVRYIEAAAETIVHLQHFLNLRLRSIFGPATASWPMISPRNPSYWTRFCRARLSRSRKWKVPIL